MANSKHAHLRYNFLDYCFRNKSYSFNEIHKALNDKIAEYYPGEGVEVRTLREDLKLFRDKKSGFGAPLPENIRIYKYSDPKFSIAEIPLLEQEQYLIETAQHLLERYQNHPKYDKLAEALIKFQDEEEQESDSESDKILFYDGNEEYKGIKFLKPLYLAIKNKRVLSVEFKGFGEDEIKTFEFHPYILRQYNRRWFVFGYNKTTGYKQWSFPLDERLVSFNIKNDVTFIDTKTNWESFFRDMIGVVKPKNSEVETVVLQFHNGRENYFKTKPFHPDYDFHEDNPKQVFFDAIINKELVQQILSYGGDVEVIKPVSLINEMKKHYYAMSGYYKK